MKFGTSEGMILAASNDDSDIFLVTVPQDAEPGMRVS